MAADHQVPVQPCRCSDCGDDLVFEHQSQQCVDCGYVPRHAAD